jgi:hypothetical protein
MPWTYFSHVRGIGWAVPYPYQLDLPRTVGWHYYGELVGSNANFWAGDGLAGFGLPGLVLMSLACGMLFWLFDSLSSHLEPGFVTVAAAFIAISFGNISLPTLLLSGGLGLLMLCLYLMPRQGWTEPIFRDETPGASPRKCQHH